MNKNHEFKVQLPITAGLSVESYSRLTLYASLSNQSREEAAQEIIKEFLEGIGEVRIQHWIDKHIEHVNAHKGTNSGTKNRIGKQHRSRSFDERLTQEDRLRARGMGIKLD
jgi:hypothetical protein